MTNYHVFDNKYIFNAVFIAIHRVIHSLFSVLMRCASLFKKLSTLSTCSTTLYNKYNIRTDILRMSIKPGGLMRLSYAKKTPHQDAKSGLIGDLSPVPILYRVKAEVLSKPQSRRLIMRQP